MQGPAKRVRMTYKDLLKLPDDGLRHELIDGEHYVTPFRRERIDELSTRPRTQYRSRRRCCPTWPSR